MVQLLPRVGAVVVGIDPRINCYKLQYGTLCMREKPGCIFVATNSDLVGRAGCMVAATCGSTERGPITVGNARVSKNTTIGPHFILTSSLTFDNLYSHRRLFVD
ncbi:hypothetical protein NC653_015253 [Populus alba x Populus x berolinensis]|uniref:Uncharacterized protein n=1 Tax=Populus alba x Populus x berolinensis TaxID=444605 RepID=A0AAD6VY04_9ROSI|nr:hypothetical protein NC653_015253 [Populus alba x Populus x berolinensis]